MARFRIRLYDYNAKLIESLEVVGRKFNEEDGYVNYYVEKPNIYGIRWVAFGEKYGKKSDISCDKWLPNYYTMRIDKIG